MADTYKQEDFEYQTYRCDSAWTVVKWNQHSGGITKRIPSYLARLVEIACGKTSRPTQYAISPFC